MTEFDTAVRLRCPECLAVFRSSFSFCPSDGATLIQCVEEPLLGATIADHYVLEEAIGEGAMGLVYRARHVRLPRQFAIKILFGDQAADSRMRLRFAQEASAACQLNHPNVVTVVDFGKSERGLLYLVMDYVEGETLRQLIEREAPLTERRVIGLARQLAEGLAHAHSQGIVHRDFKPDNVVLEPGELGTVVPRILDFGLAITFNDDVFDGRLTQHGWVVGTPAYLSPEQARDQEVDQRVDLYALGVVMYEMLAGALPFEGTAMEVAHHNMLEPVPAIHARNPLAVVSPETERVVRRLLEKDPDDRFASAEELIAALDGIQIDETFEYGLTSAEAALVLGDEPIAVAEHFLPYLFEDEEPRMRRSRRGVVIVAVAAATAGLLYLLMGGPTSSAPPVAHNTVEPEASTGTVAMADMPAQSPAETPVRSPAETPVAAAPVTAVPDTAAPEAAPVTPTGRAASAPGPVAKRASRPVRRSVPLRSPPLVARRTAPPRKPIAPRTPRALSDADVADPETSATLAAATDTPQPPARPDAEDVSVPQLIQEYRQVGQAIARLQGEGDPDVARAFRDRYFQIPYADALRIPALREDTLSQLAALRRDLAAADDGSP